MSTVLSLQGDTVDLICQRHYGRTAAVTEQVLGANPELTDSPLILPAGISIQMPDIPAQQEQSTINLWD